MGGRSGCGWPGLRAGPGAVRRSGQNPAPEVRRRRTFGRACPGPCRKDTHRARSRQDRQGLHSVPGAAQEHPRGHPAAAGHRDRRRLSGGDGLEGPRKQQHDLLPPGTQRAHNPEGGLQLLAQLDLPAGNPGCPRQRRVSYPRPGHSGSLLRGLGPAGSAHGGLPGGSGKSREQAGPAFRCGPHAGSQLPVHPPGRGRGGPGLQQLRHAAGPLHPSRRSGLRAGQTGAAEVPLQHERPHPGGFSDPLHQHHVGPERPRVPARSACRPRWRSAGPYLRGIPARNGPVQQGFRRDHVRGRRHGPSFHLPDPDVQHHPGFPVGGARAGADLGDDRQIRHSLLLQLRELGSQSGRRAQHVLPPAPGQARLAETRRRPVRLQPSHRFGGGGYPQPAADRLRGDMRGAVLRHPFRQDGVGQGKPDCETGGSGALQ